MKFEDLQTTTKNFLGELQAASSGQKTSLPFIIHQIPPFSLVKDGEIFQVLVIGGSVCKKALVKKQGNQIKILKKSEKTQPIFKTKEDLLDFVEKQLDLPAGRQVSNIKVLGLNFTYPMKPVFEKGKLDGILISGSKEHKFEGLVGKKVGAEVEKYILEKTGRQIKVSVANDTVCLLLSGLTKYADKKIVAGVVGTGMNFAIFLDEDKLVNLESANFDKFALSSEAKEIDKKSAHPGRGLFEKEIAGAYLYQHFNYIIKKNHLPHPPIKSTQELNQIAKNKIPKISDLAQNLFEKSASLVACQIAGITLFKQQNLTSVMEGSLFWENSYKKSVEKYLKKLVPHYDIKFVQIENSEILGAAKLVS